MKDPGPVNILHLENYVNLSNAVLSQSAQKDYFQSVNFDNTIHITKLSYIYFCFIEIGSFPASQSLVSKGP